MHGMQSYHLTCAKEKKKHISPPSTFMWHVIFKSNSSLCYITRVTSPFPSVTFRWVSNKEKMHLGWKKMLLVLRTQHEFALTSEFNVWYLLCLGPVWAVEAVHQSDPSAAAWAVWSGQTPGIRVLRRWIRSGKSIRFFFLRQSEDSCAVFRQLKIIKSCSLCPLWMSWSSNISFIFTKG